MTKALPESITKCVAQVDDVSEHDVVLEGEVVHVAIYADQLAPNNQRQSAMSNMLSGVDIFSTMRNRQK